MATDPWNELADLTCLSLLHCLSTLHYLSCNLRKAAFKPTVEDKRAEILFAAQTGLL